MRIAIHVFDGAEELDWAGPGTDIEVRRGIQYDPEPPV